MSNRLSAQALVPGGGELALLIARHDWSATPLGPVEAWPQALRAAVRTMLTSRFAMWMTWGDDLTMLYNDAYRRDTLDTKHPWALGRSAREVWREIWPSIGPLIDGVLAGGEATWNEGLLLVLERSGYREETYHTFSYSPLHDDDGRVRGMLCVVTEDTRRALGERRAALLGRLAAEIARADSEAGVLRGLSLTLDADARDLPFTLTYLFDEGTGRAVLAATTGFAAGAAWPAPIDDAEALFGLEEVAKTGRACELALPPQAWPSGPWPSPPTTAFATPLASPLHGRPLGVIVAGLNPLRAFDASFREFVSLFAGQLSAGLTSARAHEQDRRRAESLAELDRAKTAFFSNISHEFRTPLTLMIGPTEDALAAPDPALRGEALGALHRNELRLLKLVNSLLDFSRIEAGRMKATLEPVDLAALTLDLATGFRGAIESAGLEFVVDAPPEPLFACVDRDLWEKIELNLLSNALKFTFEGTIRIALRRDGTNAVLEVADTGTGIPAHELPRMFERFHRIEKARARTHEGSGIGLALVQELAKLHRGEVHVESEPGRGSRFTVTVPLGAVDAITSARSTVPGDAVVDAPTASAPRTASSPDAFVEEARRWIPAEPPPARAELSLREGEERRESADARAVRDEADARPCILLADDSADMRDYLTRLLAEHWRVVACADGATAVELARSERPDLVLTDVMMPGLDGFEVLAALRADERTRGVPVIMVSARAGDESRVEGLAAGADDYLVKPFSARELIARVGTHLALARARRAAESELGELYGLLMQVPAAITVRRGPEHRVVFQNAASLAVRDIQGMRVADTWLGEDAEVVVASFDRTYRTGAVVSRREVPAEHPWEAEPALFHRYWDVTNAPLRLADGRIDGVITVGIDVTERVLARQREAAAEERRRLACEVAGVGTWRFEMGVGRVTGDAALARLIGLPEETYEAGIDDYFGRIHADDRPVVDEAFRRSIRERTGYEAEFRVVWPDGTVRWLRDAGRAIRGEGDRVVAMIGAAIDMTRERELTEASRSASRAKDEFLAMLGHELRNPLAPIVTALELLALRGEAHGPEYGILDRQVRHLRRLVDDLLDISRITRGTIELERKPIDLAEVVAKAIEMARPLLERRRHRLTCDVEPGIVVTGDPVRLAQVFANLLTNAARYTPAGGDVAIAASRKTGIARLSVVDTGIGIRPAMLDRIFDQFVQAGRPMEGGENGLGIGLAIVKNLVELHGGRVQARSDGVDRGSEFVVELPLASERMPSEPAPAPSPPLDRRVARSVLVVDDNVDAAALLGELLARHGHEVRVVHHASDALVVADDFQPDVAVVDIGLPGMDGYALASRLREKFGRRPCRLIAVTGYGQAQDRERGTRAGFAGYLVKPVDAEKLLDQIDGGPDARPH